MTHDGAVSEPFVRINSPMPPITMEERQRAQIITLLQNIDFHLQDLVKSIDKLTKKVGEIP